MLRGSYRAGAAAAAAACVLALSAPARAQDNGAAQQPHRIAVRELRVEGNTLLDDARLQPVLAAWRGERTPAQLQQAAREVQALYAEAGYGGVVAYVAPQAAGAGVVTITVIEGRLARVRVQGNQRASDARVRASLPALAEGRTPQIRALDAQVALANENPSRQVHVLLEPGERTGEVDARLSVQEQPVRRGWVTLDNTGNDRTGEARLSVGWQHADVTGRDDVASVQWQTAPANPSRVNVLGAGYHLPLYRALMALDAYAAYSDVDGGRYATPVGALQFSGRGRAAGLRVSRVLWPVDGVAQRVGGGIDYRAYLNQCEISGLPQGACGPAGESVSVLPLVLDYTAQAEARLRWQAGVQLQHNLALGGGLAGREHFEAVRPGASPHYTLVRVQGNGAFAAAAWLSLRLRAAAQWSDDALVPGEQFGLGGMTSVRGFEERELTGDRGGFASLEAVGPAWVLPSGGQAELLAFADAGWLSNRGDTPCLDDRISCRIAGAGVGTRWSAGPWQAQLYLACALTRGAQTQRHDLHGHAAVTYRF